MASSIKSTDFSFPVNFDKYSGKVRDTYSLGELMVIVATDRISAFDHILPEAIPFKGQVLNQTAAHFLEATKDIVPNHVISVPDPNITIGLRCEPIPIEMVIRGYLAGHAWRLYKAGEREICGVKMPDGMKEGDKFPEPIVTPATKSAIGHDEDISAQEIIKSGLLEDDDWRLLNWYTHELYKRGSEMAEKQGLILVDTKYEFGYYDEKIYLIDEIHTPDSSRYYYLDGYAERQAAGEAQQQLSKEFVREWLMENGFQGKEGDTMPEMGPEFVQKVSDRYIGVYEHLTGSTFHKRETDDPVKEMHDNLMSALKGLGMPT